MNPLPDLSQLLVQGLSGLSYAATLFLVAAGLTIIFGVTRITNFAHGSLYMLGAYLAYSFTTRLPHTPAGFWVGILAAALVVGVIGALVEIVLLRRLQAAPEILQLLATFGIVLVVQDVALAIWGSEELFAPRAPGLGGAVRIMGNPFPVIYLLTLVLGPLALGFLLLLFRHTRWGTLVRAATADREMTAALGVNPAWLHTSVFFLGAALAGFAGAMQIPKETVNLQMDLNIIVEVFVVVVVGGLGSIGGAFAAALLIGIVHAYALLIWPQSTLVLMFVLMGVVLALRPNGLMGRELAVRETSGTLPPPLIPMTRFMRLLLAMACAALALLPLLAGEYVIQIMTDMLIAALFAASLGFLMGMAGVISFGHAAFFALGAYGAALAFHATGMTLAILSGIVLAGTAAIALGWLCARRSGVYLAMLTLAFAQICWSVAVQFVSLTGGDNGLLGLERPALLVASTPYYLLVLMIVCAALAGLRQLAFSPYGLALRAGRDAPLRAAAQGLDVTRARWLAFSVSGLMAGLAGALHAFHKGSVFPALSSVSQSVDALVMVLLGGLNSLMGPIVGAAIYQGATVQLARGISVFGFGWKGLLGLMILVLVSLFPRGVVGSLNSLLRGKRFVKEQGA